MTSLGVQDDSNTGEPMVSEGCQQQQPPDQQQSALQEAMAILPEDLLKLFPLELQAHHAAAVAGSCDAVQLLLLPAYCFLLLTEEHQNKCVAKVTVGSHSCLPCLTAALYDGMWPPIQMTWRQLILGAADEPPLLPDFPQVGLVCFCCVVMQLLMVQLMIRTRCAGDDSGRWSQCFVVDVFAGHAAA
jgi:hypothetical protein